MEGDEDEAGTLLCSCGIVSPKRNFTVYSCYYNQPVVMFSGHFNHVMLGTENKHTQ